jgi:HSP20 family protein
MPRDLIRLIHALLPPGLGPSDAPWCPAADVYQTPHGWLVKFDLAGVRPEDIDLEASGRRLTLRGTRRDCTAEEGCRHYRMEISYSRFERSLELPCRLDRATFHTRYRDGMLLVEVRPDEEEAQK